MLKTSNSASILYILLGSSVLEPVAFDSSWSSSTFRVVSKDLKLGVNISQAFLTLLGTLNQVWLDCKKHIVHLKH